MTRRSGISRHRNRHDGGAPGSAPRGLTIVEAAISVVIVAVLLVAALQTLGAAARARVIQAGQCQAPALARQLMAEIRQANYADNAVPDGPLGPEAGEATGKDRTAFDDVDDYNGLFESSCRARDGSSLPGVGDWRREVVVDWVRPDQPDVVVYADTGLKRITVTVSGPASQFKLVALRSQFSTYDQRPHRRTTYLGSVGVELKTGSDLRLYSGTNVSNQVAIP